MVDSDEWYPATKKPVEVDVRGPYHDPTVVETLEGDFEVDQQYIEDHDGYYIIRGVEDELYPIGADVFEKTYQLELKSITLTVNPLESDREFVIDDSESEITVEWERGRGHSVSFTTAEPPSWVGEPVEAVVEIDRIDDPEIIEILGDRSYVSDVDNGIVTVTITE